MTQLTTQPAPGALSTLIAGADDDFVGMRQRDFILPRANLLQALSPDVVDGKYPAGTVIDSATKLVLCEPKKDGKFVIPLMFWLEWIEWNKARNVEKDKRIIERSVDPQSKLAKRAEAWETYVDSQGREIPAVTEYYNFICAFVDPARNNYDDVYLTGFARSSHRVGKMWMNRLFKTKVNVDGVWSRAPMWSYRWAYKTELVKKDNNSFYVPCIGDGQENPRDDWSQLKALSDEFKSRRQEIMERNRNDAHDETTGEAASTGTSAAAEM